MSVKRKIAAWKGHFVSLISIDLLLILLAASTASAHNVTIFAWVEGGMVHTESKFSGGRKAKKASIEVYDKAGTKLLTGKTDENGEFSFKLPKKEELKIVLLAGMGHGNQWTLTAEDIAEAQSDPTEAIPESVSHQPTQTTSPSTPMVNSKIQTATPEFQASLEKALDKKLAPVLKKLSHLEANQKNGAGITGIIGGIGYILGLMGLAAFIQYKRKSNGQAQ